MAENAAGSVAGTPSDEALATAVRDGDMAAYGLLYARHFHAARRLAASLGITGAERDDLVAEAFTRVLRILRAGGGPGEDFRPYLLTTIRNTLISWRRRSRDMWPVPDVPDVAPTPGPEDAVCTRMHASTAARAFASLPERWQAVLWRTEVENESPGEIAEALRMTPNGVAALAYRAREGLRQAYLSEHIPATDRGTCRTIAGQLANWIRHGGTEHRTRRITTHLHGCGECRDLEASLRHLNQELPAILAPLILTAPAFLANCAASATGPWLSAVKSMIAGAVLVATAVLGTGPATPGATAPPTTVLEASTGP
ncbi:RNA polymerase sigma factor [Actinophytocola sp. KF-1]